MEPTEYRLLQDGMEVARTFGPNARAEINHYAAMYGQDGPVTIQRKRGRKWENGDG